MKRIYAAMAMAITVSAAASAAVSTTKSGLQTAVNAVADEIGYTVVENNDGRLKSPVTAEQTAGFYVWQYYSFAQGESGLRTSGIEIKVNGTDVEIYGLFDLAVIKGTFDPSAGKIRIPEQQTIYNGRASETSTPEPIWMYPVRFETDSEGKITSQTNMPYLEWTYVPAGVELQNGTKICVGGWIGENNDEITFSIPSSKGTNSGFQWTYSNRIRPTQELYGIESFKYNESEWTDCGTASLTDGWFRALDGVGKPAYDVVCKKHVSKPGHILLVDPYGKNSPYANDNADSNTVGYIYLDVNNADCVLVRPFVNSGFGLGDVYGTPDANCSVGCTNWEAGYLYFDGYTIDEVIEEFETYGDPISTMTENGLVTIPNARIQCTEYGYLTPGQWLAEGGIPITMESQISLPAAALAGVEGVINDTENAAKRYFNLQGLEIANPAAGELVIVKQGNKTTKTIVK